MSNRQAYRICVPGCLVSRAGGDKTFVVKIVPLVVNPFTPVSGQAMFIP